MKNHSLKKNLVVPLLNLVSLTLAIGLSAHAAQAADITSLKPATSHSAGVVSATNLEEDRYSLGLNADYAGSVYFNPDRNPDHAVKEAVMTSVHMGMGITRDVQLNIGLRVTDEIIDPAARAVAMKDVTGFNAAEEATRTRFAGLSLMPQYQIFKSSDVALAAALMLESGASGDKYSLTRSDNVNGGWMVMGSYGRKTDILFTANTGFRYHKPENVADYLVRNEWFYRGGVSASVFPHIGVIASAEGRRLMKAGENGPMEKGSRKYRPIYSVGYNAGVEVDAFGTEIGLYAGRARDNAEYGIGRRTYGMSLSYKFGASSNSSSIDDSSSNVVPVSANEANKAPEKKRGRGPMGEDEVDFENDLEKADSAVNGKKGKRSYEEMDDFEQMEERTRQQKGKVQESDEIERQIEQVKKVKAERLRREELKRQAEERQRAKRDYSDMKNRDRKARAVEKEVRKEVDQYPYITDEESNWNGLE